MATTPYKSSPLVQFGAHLFTSGNYSDTGILADDLLPFVDPDSSKENAWVIPSFDTEGGDSKNGVSYGRNAAAAYAILVGHTGVETYPCLSDILTNPEFHKDLMSKKRNGHYAANSFVRQIQRYLWALGQLASPAQLAGDVAAYFEQEEAVAAEWRARDEEEETPSESEAPSKVALPTWHDDTQLEEEISVLDRPASAANIFAATMWTDSMEPTIDRGSALVFRWVDDARGCVPKEGDIVAAYVCPYWAGQTIDDRNPHPDVIRRYFKSVESGKITLKADNPAYGDITEEVNDKYSVEIIVVGVLAPDFQSSRHISKKERGK